MPIICLERFMIFNSNEGQHESQEEEKVIYHWVRGKEDHNVSLREQIDDICLCDATVNVSGRLADSSLSKLQDADQVHETSTGSSTGTRDTLKPNVNGKSFVLNFDTTKVIILEIEPQRSIWAAAHISDSSIDTNDIPQNSTQQPDINNIPSGAIQRVINNMYARFCLLNGTFEMISKQVEIDQKSQSKSIRASVRKKLRQVCQDFFDNLLPEIHLNSILCNLASLYNNILYLDLNPLTLMKVNSFVNHLVCLDADIIRHSIVIFNDKLLWSSLNKYDTRILYNNLVPALIRDALQEELTKEVDKVRRVAEDLPIYLTDPSLTNGESDTKVCDTNFMAERNQKEMTKNYMTVFRSSNNLTLGLIFTKPGELELIQRCQQILTSDSRLGVIPMASLAQSVGQNFIKANKISLEKSTSSKTLIIDSSTSSSNSRRQPIAEPGVSARSRVLIDHKYILIDRIHSSISWPISMELHSKEHLAIQGSDSSGVSSTEFSGRKSRLIRYLVDLEPELAEISSRVGSQVSEFFGKSSNDSWLTVTNCKFRSIYSFHKVRNSSLSEVQQNASNLRFLLASNLA